MALNTIFQTGIFCFLTFVLVFVWMKTFRRSLDPRIPVLKFRYWSIMGTVSLNNPLRGLSKQTSLDMSNYFVQLLHALSIIHKDCDIFCVWLAFSPFIILRKAKVVEEVLNNTTILEKAWSYNMLHPWLGRGLLTSAGSRWKTRRKLLTPSFHFDILKDFQLVFDEQSKVLVDILKGQCHKDGIDIIPYITLCSLDIICESTLGVKFGAQRNSNAKYTQSVLRASKLVMERVTNPYYWFDFIYNLLPVGRKFNSDIKILHEFARNIIKQKKAALLQQGRTENGISNQEVVTLRKRKALMDLLLDVHLSNQGLSEEDIREEIDTFAFEGHDTTSMGMSWALYLLGLYPDVQAKVHEELDRIFGDDTEREVTIDDLKQMHYLECVLKESQRLYPSVPMIGRQIQEDVKFCGYNLKKGTVLIVLTYVLHRDEDVFSDPEKFDPSRFYPENCVGRHPYAYVPFSAGPRNCIGQRFAMMEEKTVVAHVLRNFVLRSLEPRDRICPSAELILRSSQALKIQITKRKP